ncbi:hypothetical protein ABEB36_005961 [Hypothenemus hampei]|uniref:Carboxylic ester hydrolase n=1 Tax=Hypothenemus hampei TaxID=57062 RepID=A0ABD1F007_HYPHA
MIFSTVCNMAVSALALLFPLILGSTLAQQVTTPDGPVKGIAKTTNSGKTYYAYYSIPYAKPPTGARRFLASEPVAPWTEVYDATIEKENICFQMNSKNNFPETEDCLYLSVFTPQDPSSSGSNYPVYVNIHGGGFTGGSSRINNGTFPNYFIDEDVIIVVLNYRLGVFGFLSTGDDVIPGNAGISDQILALKWIKKNIIAFGGDPDKITIAGQSAGAKSVGYLILSPQASGLFSAGVMESGSPLCIGGYQRNHTEIAFKIGSFVDSQFENSIDSKELLQVLQNADTKSINNAAKSFVQWLESQSYFYERNPYLQGYYFTPVVDSNAHNPVLPKLMYEAVANGSINKVPIFIGVCSEEGLLDGSYKNHDYLTAYDNTPSLLDPQDMNIQGEKAWSEVGRLIKNKYSPSSTYVNNPLGVLQYYTDQQYVRGSTKYAELHSQFADVYYYQFSFTGDLDGGNNGYSGSGNVSHVGNSAYIYGGKSLEGVSEGDQLTSKRLVKIWTNFAKYRNPTPEPDSLLQNITWPKVTPENFQHVDIGNYTATDLVITKGKPKYDRMAFWDEMYQAFGNRPYDTY